MFYIALWASKLYLFILKLLKLEKDDKPGFLAYKLCPNFLEKLNKPDIVIGITGTNGKTTTTNLLADCLKKGNYKVIYNEWGANTLGGYARCLIQGVNIFNKKKDVIAILEMDEVTCDKTIPLVDLKYLIVTNLFRDSMQRNANPDYVYEKLLSGINKDIVLILNADDPFSSMLGEKNNNKCIYYGIDKLKTDHKTSNNLINDFLTCPKCSSNLKYEYIRYHQIGKVYCPNCNFESKQATYLATLDFDNNKLNIKNKNNFYSFKMINDTIFNCYNELAVITMMFCLNIDEFKIKSIIEKVNLPKNRYLNNFVNGIEITNLACKDLNAVATSRVLDYINSLKENLEVILLLDDQFDNKNNSEAVTWVYDTDFELLNKDNIKRIIVGGVRNRDYRLRLLLAGVPNDKIFTCDKEEDVINYVTTKNIDKIFILNEVYFISGGLKINELIVDKIKKENAYENRNTL